MLKSKIDTYYIKHDSEMVSQGDILRDFSFIIIGKGGAQLEITFSYLVILSQDCDLEQGSKIISLREANANSDVIEFNQYLHNVMFCPAFVSEQVKSGDYLKDYFKIQAKKIDRDLYKPIKKNENPRYHMLPSDSELQLPELLIDFKAYYTVPFDVFIEGYKDCYLATANELFREDLSQRFSFYLNRISLPEIASSGAD